MLTDFVNAVKQDCSIDKQHFNFYYIPDLIVRRKYNRKDYEPILKLLNKVKKQFLETKWELMIKAKLAEEFAKKKHKNNDYDYEEEYENMKNAGRNTDRSDGDQPEKVTDAFITDEDKVPHDLFQ
jgi:folylpolyglutamate synthase/dihydropteroate synthase